MVLKRKKELFGEIKPFDMTATYIEIDSNSPLNVYDDHIHNECEIYINLSGDVSFAVENSVYPIMPGGIIITRPLEYHHCISGFCFPLQAMSGFLIFFINGSLEKTTC